MKRLARIQIVAVVALVLSASAAWAGENLNGRASENHISFTAARSEELAQENAGVAPALRLHNYERAALCREVAGTWTKGFSDGTCPPPASTAGVLRDCADGDHIVMPMWRQSRATADAPWGAWQQVDSGGCGVDLLPVLTEADFRRLPLPAPALNIQPAGGWVLVNIPTIVYTDPTPVTLRTDLLGYGVTVEATPTSWTYDFGDNTTPLTTTDPGRPHPAFDVTHTYRTPGTAQITLATTWTGRYQIDGTTLWREINGTATTTTTSDPITIEERTSRLVAELCTATPTPPDC